MTELWHSDLGYKFHAATGSMTIHATELTETAFTRSAVESVLAVSNLCWIHFVTACTDTDTRAFSHAGPY